MLEKSFDNLVLGPVISIDSLKDYESTVKEITERELIITSVITDTTHEIFKMYLESELKTIPVVAFITIKYLNNYN
jgi:hypothetical protein